jgi:hypothetical protein
MNNASSFFSNFPLFFTAGLLFLSLSTPIIGSEPAPDSLPPLKGGKAPETFEDLWYNYDPSKEPLDIEILNKWEKDGVILKAVRFRAGIFKGRKSMIAGIYGYPKDAKNLPGLLQIHGGGQSASENAVLTNAKRGYATLSIAWAGRIAAGPYMVSHAGVKLFNEGETDDPNYRLTTDWGAIDAYHDPSRNKESNFGATKPTPWTLDAIDSPRNSAWFFCTLAARRGLTFLENQPEVDGSRLGVYGHSMGGQQTVAVAGTDARVKAAAPSCGGVSYKIANNPAAESAGGDAAHLARIKCPIIFLMPSNDFNGRIEDLQTGLGILGSKTWRIASAPNHNHQDSPEYEVATQLWFDEHLKGTFKIPATPDLKLSFENGTVSANITPDLTLNPVEVNVYYTQQGPATKGRPAYFWRPAKAIQSGNTWTADLPLLDTSRPVWVFANVTYPLSNPVSGAGYYYRDYTTDRFTISSRMLTVEPSQLIAKGLKPSLAASLLIESFEQGWEKSWFTYRPEEWGRHTLKLSDPQWRAPAGVALEIEVQSDQPNKMAVAIDDTATEVELIGGPEWQKVRLTLADFKNFSGTPRKDWENIIEFRFGREETLASGRGEERKSRILGGMWLGDPPRLRNLRWVPATQK